MSGCCEQAGPDGWCRAHRKAAGEARSTYRPDRPGAVVGPLLPGPGLRFTPDATGGGRLVDNGNGRTIRKEAHHG